MAERSKKNAERREKDRKRKAEARKEESEEKRERRLLYQKKRQQMSMDEENEEEKQERLLNMKKRQQMSRDEENEEEKQERLLNMKKRQQMSRDEENEEEKQERLLDKRKRQQMSRDEENEEERQERLLDKRKRQQMSRDEENEEERQERLLDKRKRQQTSRDEENEEERQERLLDKRKRQQTSRDEENEEERQERLLDKRKRQQTSRDEENEEERQERLLDKRKKQQMSRDEENEEERQERLLDNRKRQQTSRDEENEEERQERLFDKRKRQQTSRDEENEEERQERLFDKRKRQQTSRDEENEEERQERLFDKRKRQQTSRDEENEEERQERLFDKRKRQQTSRDEENEEERQERLFDKRKRQQTSRDEENEEERQERLFDKRKRQQTSRDEENEEERQERLVYQRNRNQMSRKQNRNRQKKTEKIACRAYEVINGTQPVEGCNISPLFDCSTKEPNGRICEHCNAMLWETEPKGLCCCSGQVKLVPLFDINNQNLDWFKDLCLGESVESSIYRKFSRNINNAVSFASLKVQRVFPEYGGWIPAVVIQGKVAIQIGPLLRNRTNNSPPPVFSNLYVLDDDEATDELKLRFGSMFLSKNATEVQKQDLLALLNKLQVKFREVNPYVKDYMSAAEIIKEDDRREKMIRLTIDADKRPEGEHLRRFNTDFHEITVLFDDENPGPRDIVLVNRGEGNHVQTVRDTNRACDPLRFTVMFPEGDDGWHLGMKNEKRKNLTGRMFYSYHLMIRYPIDKFFSPVLHSGKLTQEYMCLNAAKIENQELFYIKRKETQKKLRAETYSKLTEQISAHDVEMQRQLQEAVREGREAGFERQPLTKVGLPVILPSTHTGSPRYMHKHYQDAMAIVRELGKPDLFITFTCNAKWPEILESLPAGETANDRPDIVIRVFRVKLHLFIDDITKGCIFGRPVAHIYVIEFQKRGLPHCHLLVILTKESKIESPEDVDRLISAEFPVPEDCPEGAVRDRARKLLELVKTHMVHTCSRRCRPEGHTAEKCQKHFPQDYCQQTMWDKDGYYPYYRRRKGDADEYVVEMANNKLVDNRNVIAYSPWLLMKYGAHINVEVCVSVRTVKYLYKYIHKGPDRMMCVPELNDLEKVEYRNDEVEKYQDMRSIGSSEACWNIFSFPITDRDPAVTALRIHLEDQQTVIVNQSSEAEVRAAANDPNETELIGFFKYNAMHKDEDAKYCDFPKDHVWKSDKKAWQNRQKCRVIGRVHTVHPTSGDVFYLRLLLHHDHCRGKVSFKDLKTVNGVIYENFHGACEALGLLQNDGEWDSALQEAAETEMSSQIRDLFVVILMNCKPSDPSGLFERHYTEWIDDLKRKYEAATEKQLRIIVLLKLEKKLQLLNRELKDFKLPLPTDDDRADIAALMKKQIATKDTVIRQEELNFDIEELKAENEERYKHLNQGQCLIYNEVMELISSEKPGTFFIDARGGTGKTFLLNTLLSGVQTLKDEKNIALAVAYSGIAATLLSLGRTFHSRFKVPVDFTDETVVFRVKPNDSVGKVIKDAKLIVWDEGPMSHRYLLEGLDRLLQDIMDTDVPFGGKVLIISGDFRQVLPVIKKASRAQITSAALNHSGLWKYFQIRQLTENMRVGNNPDLEDFDDWLGFLGNGELPCMMEPDWVNMESNYPFTSEIDDTDDDSIAKSLTNFVEKVFPDLESQINSSNWMSWVSQRAILAPRNVEVDMINAHIVANLPGKPTVLTSADATINDDEQTSFPVEFLNCQTPAGLPPHKLTLKQGMILILLRNLNPRKGLCNGTRLIVKKASKLLIECKLATEIKDTENTVLIPRIELTTDKSDFPIQWKRRQFPVRPAFAMTINKAQGQTFQEVGIWLNEPCFGHGQLYVACSRVGKPESLHIAIKKSNDKMTRNVVYKEALTSSND